MRNGIKIISVQYMMSEISRQIKVRKCRHKIDHKRFFVPEIHNLQNNGNKDRKPEEPTLLQFSSVDLFAFYRIKFWTTRSARIQSVSARTFTRLVVTELVFSPAVQPQCLLVSMRPSSECMRIWFYLPDKTLYILNNSWDLSLSLRKHRQSVK